MGFFYAVLPKPISFTKLGQSKATIETPIQGATQSNKSRTTINKKVPYVSVQVEWESEDNNAVVQTGMWCLIRTVGWRSVKQSKKRGIFRETMNEN